MREGHRRSEMTEPDCTVMCNFLNKHKQTHTHIRTHNKVAYGKGYHLRTSHSSICKARRLHTRIIPSG